MNTVTGHPWEKVGLNIEGDDIMPVIWRKQLFIFWVNIIEKASEGDRSKDAQTISNEPWGNHARRNVEVNICWGEYYKGKWTSPKSTEMKRPMIIKNLASFDSNKLLIFGKKEKVVISSNNFRERLIFNLRYKGNGGSDKNAVFTFTSKNAPPYLEYRNDDDIMVVLKEGLDILFFNPYPESGNGTRLYSTQYLMPGRVLKVNVKQPHGASSSEKTETVLTKKDKLTPGFQILPLRHIAENQYNAPVFYADEHSNFYLQADETKYSPIRIWDAYYPYHETPVKYLEIPELVEKPVPGWPPKESIDIDGGLVVDNPWIWSEQAVRINENYTMVLPTDDKFDFGGTTFDTGGKVFGSF